MTGQDIAAIREKHQLSRDQLGTILGKSYRSVLRWEKEADTRQKLDRPTVILLELLRDNLLPARYLIVAKL